MKHKKIITVFGATGVQGGFARATLNDKKTEFVVRAVTRNVNSDKAKKLESMGAEIVARNSYVPARQSQTFSIELLYQKRASVVSKTNDFSLNVFINS